MEKPSSRLQVAFSMLVGLIVIYILATAFLMSGLATPPIGLIAAISTQAVILVLAFIFLPLLWWRNKVGYIGAMVVGISATINALIALSDALAGATPGEGLLVIMPWLVISVVLIASSAATWREKA